MENTLVVLALKNEAEAVRLKEKLILQDSEVFIANTKSEIIKLLLAYEVDLLITDMQIEDADAIEICKEVKQLTKFKQPFIIVFSERPEDYVQSLALDAGADDYILKPSKPAIIMARINALLSRKEKVKEKKRPVISNGLFIDKEKHVVYFNSKEIEIPPKEFNILSVLYSEPNKVFTRKEITDIVMGKDSAYNIHTIDVYIYNIRKMIGNNIVETIKGSGYRLLQ